MIENMDCFAKFCKSHATDPDDDELHRYFCEKAGIEKTYWDDITEKTLKNVCETECPFKDSTTNEVIS